VSGNHFERRPSRFLMVKLALPKRVFVPDNARNAQWGVHEKSTLESSCAKNRLGREKSI
jgi:hypothetical protein